MTIGVLGIQGAFKEHIEILEKMNVKTKIVRYAQDLETLDGLILPGGESTAMIRVMKERNLHDEIYKKINEGLFAYGTCAGLILLSKHVKDLAIPHIPVIDIGVVRNAYGTQVDSFHTLQKIKYVEGPAFPMVFIRAPMIVHQGPNVEVLAMVNDKVVAAREKNVLVTSFHPELTTDNRMHKLFIDWIRKMQQEIKKHL